MKKGLSPERKEELLSQSFNYLIKNGLENTTLRSFGQELFGSPSSMYLYFDDKEDWIVETAKYGLSTSADILFKYAFANITDMERFFTTVIEEIDKVKERLRAVYQVATSPVYGADMRKAAEGLNEFYHQYIGRLSDILGCRPETIIPSVFNFISIMLDYVVWEDREITQVQFADLYKTMEMKLKAEKQ